MPLHPCTLILRPSPPINNHFDQPPMRAPRGEHALTPPPFPSCNRPRWPRWPPSRRTLLRLRASLRRARRSPASSTCSCAVRRTRRSMSRRWAPFCTPASIPAPSPSPRKPSASATLKTRPGPAPLLTGRIGHLLLPLQHLHHRGHARRQGPARLVLDDGGQARRLPQGVGHLSPPASAEERAHERRAAEEPKEFSECMGDASDPVRIK